MSEASQGAKCAVCGQLLKAAQGVCPSCGVSSGWQELIQAMEFVQNRFEQWAKERTIAGGPLDAITQDYNQQRQTANRMAREGRPLPSDAALMSADHCWSCQAAVVAGREHCAACGVPVGGPLVQGLRCWTYACHRIKSHCDAGRLPLVQAHACLNDAKSHIAALRSRLEQDRLDGAVVLAEAIEDGNRPVSQQPPLARASDSSAGTSAPSTPRPPLWEIILDPRTIQWLLGLGGVLLVVGLVIWLATLGNLQNPLVVAVSLGIGNAVVLAGGWATSAFPAIRPPAGRLRCWPAW